MPLMIAHVPLMIAHVPLMIAHVPLMIAHVLLVIVHVPRLLRVHASAPSDSRQASRIGSDRAH